MSTSIVIRAIVYVPSRPTLMHAARKRILVRDYMRYCNSLVEQVSDIMHYLLERGYIISYSVAPHNISILFSCDVGYTGGKPVFTYDRIYFEVLVTVPAESEKLRNEIRDATEHAIKLLGWVPEQVWVV